MPRQNSDPSAFLTELSADLADAQGYAEINAIGLKWMNQFGVDRYASVIMHPSPGVAIHIQAAGDSTSWFRSYKDENFAPYDCTIRAAKTQVGLLSFDKVEDYLDDITPKELEFLDTARREANLLSGCFYTSASDLGIALNSISGVEIPESGAWYSGLGFGLSFVVARQAVWRRDSTASAARFTLTPKERDVLCYVRDGLTNYQIAAQLGITDRGVRKHLCNIYQKTGISDRYQAAFEAELAGQLA